MEIRIIAVKVGLILYLSFICICVVAAIILVTLNRSNQNARPVEKSTVKPPPTVPSTVSPSTATPTTNTSITITPSTAVPSTPSRSSTSSTVTLSTAIPSTATPSPVVSSTAHPTFNTAIEVAEYKCNNSIKVACDNPVPSNIMPLSNVSSPFEERRAHSGEFPHMAYAKVSSAEYCGGTLISEYFVMTTALCIFGHTNITVKLGDDILSKNSERWYDVDEIIVHERFNSTRRSDNKNCFNIALLKLKTKVDFDWTKRPICLDTDIRHSESLIGVSTTDISWRLKTSPPDLVHVMDNLFRDEILHEIWDCSGGLEQIIGSTIKRFQITPDTYNKICQAEFGGPLQALFDKTRTPCDYTYLQIGISYALRPDCRRDPTILHLRIDQYIPWIVSKVWPEFLK